MGTKKEGKLGAATTQSMLDESCGCERSDEEERVSVRGETLANARMMGSDVAAAAELAAGEDRRSER